MDRNRHFPFNPSEVDCLLLSHAHIDHCGNIPNLVRQGFRGPIFTNHATRDLATLMLEDSAHIQEADCLFINRRNEKLGKTDAVPAEPLYTIQDARAACRQFISVAYDRPFDITEGCMVTFSDAGHILGSSEIIFDLSENGRRLRLVFSGDIGRGGNDILRDPTPFEEADILILESTYGGRVHEPQSQVDTKLAEVVCRTVERGGRVIIPAFSVGRSQQLIYSLRHLTERKLIPKAPVYVDSPLSVHATEVFRMHPDCFNDSTSERLRRHEDPFELPTLTFVRTVDESKALNDQRGSCVIIAASGMCEAGRIRHHLRNNIDDAKNTILMVGFCAPNTLGRFLAERHPTVNIFGEKHEVKAEIDVIDALSAHADRNELLGLVQRSTGAMTKIFLTHGQEDQSEALARSLAPLRPGSRIHVPHLHESIDL